MALPRHLQRGAAVRPPSERRSSSRPTDLQDIEERTSDDNAADPETQLERREQRRAVDDALGALPDTLRAAFVLRDIEELSTAEAAAALEISESALKVRLHRARQAVRTAITPDVLPPTTTAAGMSCETALGWLDDYLDGTLPAEPRALLEAHVDHCNHCRINVDIAHRTVEMAGTRRHWVIPAPRSSAMFDRLAVIFDARERGESVRSSS